MLMMTVNERSAQTPEKCPESPNASSGYVVFNAVPSVPGSFHTRHEVSPRTDLRSEEQLVTGHRVMGQKNRKGFEAIRCIIPREWRTVIPCPLVWIVYCVAWCMGVRRNASSFVGERVS